MSFCINYVQGLGKLKAWYPITYFVTKESQYSKDQDHNSKGFVKKYITVLFYLLCLVQVSLSYS